jgi:hypothetical protein
MGRIKGVGILSGRVVTRHRNTDYKLNGDDIKLRITDINTII